MSFLFVLIIIVFTMPLQFYLVKFHFKRLFITSIIKMVKIIGNKKQKSLFYFNNSQLFFTNLLSLQ